MIDTRKLTENGFGLGLVMDASLFNQSNNTLSNCLNGTTVTFNGNEFMLQNDMGNGRVESAYLPAGYVPIGIKEYGGVIYIASYNPLTNKGLIGSFPSPERNISDVELGNANITIGSGLFGLDSNGQLKKFYVKLKLLGNENILRPGDSFSLGFRSSSQNLAKYITDYNTKGNRLIRIGVAIMDNEGNLLDITNLLKLFDNNYFMYKYEYANADNTVDDIRSNLSKANIYGGKISGKLYLTVEINTPNEYELEIDGEKKEDTNNYIVNFKGILDNKLSETYFKGVKAILNSNTFYLEAYTKENHSIIHELEVETDLKYLDYKITPCMEYGELKAFTKEGRLNLTLLNSGIVELNEWRYYNDYSSEYLYLNWGLSAYLRNKEFIKEVNFSFYEYDTKEKQFKQEPIIIRTNSRRNYNGSFSENIPYGDIQKGKLYLVLINVIKANKNEPDVTTTQHFYRALYTCTYFNLFYALNLIDFISVTLKADIGTEVKTIDSSNILTKIDLEQSDMFYSTQLEKVNPFFIKKHETSSLETLLEFNYELVNNGNLPFDLNFNTYKIVTTANSKLNSKCELANLNIYSLNDKEGLSKNFDVSSLNNNLVPKNDKGETYKFWYNDYIKDNKLHLDVNTVTEYSATLVKEEIQSNRTNYIPYLNSFTSNGMIYGYDIPNYPEKGFSTAYGGRKHEDSAKRTYGNFIEIVKTNPFEFKTIGESIYPTGDTGKDGSIQPSMNRLLEDLLASAYKQNINPHLPIIQFWIAADIQSGMDKTHYALFKKSLFTKLENYVLLVWRNADNKYYVLNSIFKRCDPTVINKIYALLSNLYIELNYSFSKELFRPGDYSYIQNFDVNYSCSVEFSNKVELVTTGEEKDINGSLLNFRIADINKAVDNLTKVVNDKEIIKNNIKNNITVEELNFDFNSSVDIKKEILSTSIDEDVFKFNSFKNSALDKSLITFDEKSNILKFYTKDFLGLDLTKRIYYISKDKVYPIENLEGFEASPLNTVINKEGLSNLDVKWDNYKQYNLIILNPTNFVKIPAGLYPCLGNVSDGPTHSGYIKFSEGKVVNLAFKSIDKIYD